MKKLMNTILLILIALTATTFVYSQEVTNLGIKDEKNSIRITVKNGEIERVTVNDNEVPKERVKLVGNGLNVVNETGEIIGAMANLSAGGKSPLRKKENNPIPVYNDNEDLKIEIKDNRFLLVTKNGKSIPAEQIKFEENALKIYDENGDVLRVIKADNPRP
jgi:hypothetical protein